MDIKINKAELIDLNVIESFKCKNKFTIHTKIYNFI